VGNFFIGIGPCTYFVPQTGKKAVSRNATQGFKGERGVKARAGSFLVMLFYCSFVEFACANQT